MKTNIIADYEFSEWELKVIRKLKSTKKIYTTLLRVSTDYNAREIQFDIVMNGEISNISYLVGKLLDIKMNSHCNGLVVKGVGMDMGFSVAYRLGKLLKIKDLGNIWF